MYTKAYPLFLSDIISSGTLVAEITIYNLAALIMLLIAFWGIGRIFRSGEGAEDEPVRDDPYDDEEDEFDDDDYEEE